MVRFSFLLGLAFLLSVTVSLADNINATSAITDVTIYPGMAVVTRSARGKPTLKFLVPLSKEII